MYLGVPRGDVLVWSTVFIIWMGTVCADHVHISRNDHTEDLFSCPQRLWLENGWLYKLAIPIRNPHHQIHHSVLMKQSNIKHEVPVRSQEILFCKAIYIVLYQKFF